MEVKCMNNKSRRKLVILGGFPPQSKDKLYLFMNAIESNNNYKRRHSLPSRFMKASKYEDNKEMKKK